MIRTARSGRGEDDEGRCGWRRRQGGAREGDGPAVPAPPRQRRRQGRRPAGAAQKQDGALRAVHRAVQPLQLLRRLHPRRGGQPSGLHVCEPGQPLADFVCFVSRIEFPGSKNAELTFPTPSVLFAAELSSWQIGQLVYV